MKIKAYWLVLLFCWSSIGTFAQEQKMSDGEIVVFKQTVNAVAKKIKTLSTDFVQYKHLDFLSKDIETSGKMFFKQPNLLNWKYTKPYNYSIVFKNNKIYINNEGNKSAVDMGNNKMFEKINKLIVGSVSGDMFDDAAFTITYFKSKDGFITRLLPKDAALKKYIKQIELVFDKQEGIVKQVKLIESSNDFTRIVFKNKLINAPIDDSAFNN